MEFTCCKKTISDAYDPLICSSCRQCFMLLVCYHRGRSENWMMHSSAIVSTTLLLVLEGDVYCKFATVKTTKIVQVPNSTPAKITIDEMRSLIKSEIY